MIDYSRFPALAGVYLEDSFVLAISEMPGQFVLRLEAVLTPEHPAYRAPSPGEHYCYAPGHLFFADVTHVEWIRGPHGRYTDASGEDDLGNIDILRVDGNAYVVEGDWGEFRIVGAQLRFKLGQVSS